MHTYRQEGFQHLAHSGRGGIFPLRWERTTTPTRNHMFRGACAAARHCVTGWAHLPDAHVKNNLRPARSHPPPGGRRPPCASSRRRQRRRRRRSRGSGGSSASRSRSRSSLRGGGGEGGEHPTAADTAAEGRRMRSHTSAAPSEPWRPGGWGGSRSSCARSPSPRSS